MKHRTFLTIAVLAAMSSLSGGSTGAQTPIAGSRFLRAEEIQALISGNVRTAANSRGQNFTEEYGATGLMVGRSFAGSDSGQWRAVQGPRGNATLCTRFNIWEGGRELCTEIMVGLDRVPRWPNGAPVGLRRY